MEAAYTRDPKPDKDARLKLVEQVALGEKEVQVRRHSTPLALINTLIASAQIWFQNRRQSSRRRSRPLLPHEVVQYQLARSGLSASHVPDVENATSADHGNSANHSSNRVTASKPVTGYPCLRRWVAMPKPMAPRPMKATGGLVFAMFPLCSSMSLGH